MDPVGITDPPSRAAVPRLMLFPTVTFALFFLIVLPVSWLLMPHRSAWRVFMWGASWFFYGYWNWRFVGLLALSTLWNWGFGQVLRSARGSALRRAALAVAVVGNLGVLGYFKYYGFFVTEFQNMLGRFGIEHAPTIITVTLPVGISFFTFQALSYVFDVYRRDIETTSLLNFTVYLSFFPQLVAGPIVRASEFLPQLRHRADPRHVDSSRAFFLIMSGLFKKVVLADFLAKMIVDPVFADPSQASALETLIGIYGFAVQIYADFSGYTDIAIGIALLLGFRFPDNFNSPYTAESIQDFWRRWHMTLSRWLRDYLYVPLGGNRGSALATYRNLMLTMVLGGLWHGAAWNFVIWGAIHGGAMATERYMKDQRRARGLPEPPDTVARRWFRRIWTFQIVCFGWVFFRSDTFGDAMEMLGRLVSGWGAPTELVTPAVLLAITYGIATQFVPRGTIARMQAYFSRLSPIAQGFALAFGLLIIDAMGPEGVSPFLYFAF